MLAFYCLNAAVYFFLKSSFLHYIKNNYTIEIDYTLLFIYIFQSIYNIIINFYLLYVFSLIMHIYFFYSIFTIFFELKNSTEKNKFNFSFKFNKFLLKAHLYVIIKDCNLFNKFLIISFTLFKLKILFKIFFLEYFGLFSSLPVLYFQVRFYKNLMNAYSNINTTFLFHYSLEYLIMLIQISYLEHKRLTYIILIIILIEFISLIMLSINILNSS